MLTRFLSLPHVACHVQLAVSMNPSQWVSPTTHPPPWFVLSPHGGKVRLAGHAVSCYSHLTSKATCKRRAMPSTACHEYEPRTAGVPNDLLSRPMEAKCGEQARL